MCNSRSAHFLRTSAEKRAARMPALKKGLKVSPTKTVAGSFFIIKKKRWPCGSYFPGTFHSMDAVRKHTLHPDPSKAKRPPRSAFPTNFGGSRRQPFARHFLLQALGPRPPTRIFFTLQGFVQRNSWIFEVLFPKVIILSRFFRGCCLYA